MVAHLVWDQGVAGSIPVFPTKAPAEMPGLFCFWSILRGINTLKSSKLVSKGQEANISFVPKSVLSLLNTFNGSCYNSPGIPTIMKKLLLLFFLNLAGLKICACDCYTGDDFLKFVDVAFRAHVIAIREHVLPIKERIVTDSFSVDSFHIYEIEVKVYKWMKGHMQTDTCKIYEPNMETAFCNVLFELNDSFKVYAFYVRTPLLDTDTPLYTDACSRTHNIKYNPKY